MDKGCRVHQAVSHQSYHSKGTFFIYFFFFTFSVTEYKHRAWLQFFFHHFLRRNLFISKFFPAPSPRISSGCPLIRNISLMCHLSSAACPILFTSCIILIYLLCQSQSLYILEYLIRLDVQPPPPPPHFLAHPLLHCDLISEALS